MSIATEIQRIQTAKADIKTAIEAKGVVVDETAKIDTYASKVDDVYNAGYEKGKSEGGGGVSPTTYASVIHFSSDDWAESDTVEIYAPNLSNINRTLFYTMAFNKIKNLTVKVDTPITYCNGGFQGSGDDTLEKLILYVDFSQCTYFANVFMSRKTLVSIEGNPINFSSATSIGSGTFAYCSNLRSFRVVRDSIMLDFDLKHCSRLDNDTIQSVIDGLADLTGGTAQTLTLHSNVVLRLTDEQALMIDNKNWILA